MNVKFLCTEQQQRYPALQTQDLVKALYQAEFGCGHLISDPERGKHWLMEEMAQCPLPLTGEAPSLAEPLGRFVRVHLQAAREQGLRAETIFALFELSARERTGDMSAFLSQLDMLEGLIAGGTLSLHLQDARAYLKEYRQAGCPAARHSPAFRDAYAPAYRVIRAEYARFLPLFAAIDRRMTEGRPVTVAIEGGSASGKSTLGELLVQIYGCTQMHMDDFFLQPHQRTPERFAEPGGNVDYERFLAEVLLPLRSRQPFSYRPFSCHTMTLGEPVSVVPERLCIVEGAYSMHPALAEEYDLSVFLQISPEEQADRILHRNGEKLLQRFLTEWIPLEQRYFDQCSVKQRCTLIL